MAMKARTPEQQRVVDRFNAACETEVERSNCSRREAIANVSRRDRELLRQYLLAMNPAATADEII